MKNENRNSNKKTLTTQKHKTQQKCIRKNEERPTKTKEKRNMKNEKEQGTER